MTPKAHAERLIETRSPESLRVRLALHKATGCFSHVAWPIVEAHLTAPDAPRKPRAVKTVPMGQRGGATA